jgi:hypothetical protein
MAADAAYIALAVGRTLKDRVLTCVASQTVVVDLPGRCCRWIEDLELVAAALDMSLTRSVAASTRNFVSAMRCGRPCMRIAGKAAYNS